MEITFVGDYSWNDNDERIRFLAREGERRIVCEVKGETLTDVYGATSVSPEAAEVAFIKHRDEIQQLASLRIRLDRTHSITTVLI